jgi:hypothetical protein
MESGASEGDMRDFLGTAFLGFLGTGQLAPNAALFNQVLLEVS